jgi:hypothetical protein
VHSTPARPSQGIHGLVAVLSNVTVYLNQEDIEEVVIASIRVLNGLDWLVTWHPPCGALGGDYSP